MIRFIKRNKYFIIFFFLTFIIGFAVFYKIQQGSVSSKKEVAAAKSSLPVLTEKDILGNNGENPNKPIYIGLDGYVYDVTAGRDFYKPGGPYHDLAGHDSTDQLKIFGGGIIKRKYPIVALLKDK